jgi:predicted dehydrogenase
MGKSQSSKLTKWGIIGLGNIAGKFAEDLLLIENAVLQGVASRDASKARIFAETYKARKVYDNYETLTQDPDIDIIYIATPHVFHFEHTMLCLKAGKAVLCEKPFAMNLVEAKTMLDEAKRRNLFIMEAMWTRFIPGTEKVLELIANGAIGSIELVKADFGFKGDGNLESRVYNKSLGAGSLLDIGIYPVYLSLLLCGVPDTIRAIANFTNTGVDASTSMLFGYASGTNACLESTIIADTPIEALIFGTNGSLQMHSRFHHTKEITLKLNDGKMESFNQDYTGNGYYHEILEVMHCLQHGLTESPKMPHSISLNLMQILDEVREKIGLRYDGDNPERAEDR